MKEAVRVELNTVWITRILCGTFKDTLVVFPKVPGSMGHTSILYDWKEYIFHRGCSLDMQSILASGLIPGGKENDKAQQAQLFTLLSPFGDNPDDEKLHDNNKIRQEVHYHSYWKRDRDASRSRIAILANEVIFDHHPQSRARRLPCAAAAAAAYSQ